MPSYANNPFTPPVLLQKGVPVYLYGSYNYRQANTRMLVSNSALTSNVVTLTVQIVEGEIPTVGSLVSVQQTTAGSGALNVNRAPLTAVSITATTGAGTISYALTHANVTSVADAGTAIAEVPEVPETLANGSSIACCVQFSEGDGQSTLPYAVSFPTIPTAATINLQAAIHNIDAEFTTVIPIASVAGGVVGGGQFGQVTLQRGYFYRLITSGLSGSGTIVAKVG